MVIYCATWLQEESQRQALDQMGKRERLLSYHFIKDQNKITLKEYVHASKPNRAD